MGVAGREENTYHLCTSLMDVMGCSFSSFDLSSKSLNYTGGVVIAFIQIKKVKPTLPSWTFTRPRHYTSPFPTEVSELSLLVSSLGHS